MTGHPLDSPRDLEQGGKFSSTPRPPPKKPEPPNDGRLLIGAVIFITLAGFIFGMDSPLMSLSRNQLKVRVGTPPLPLDHPRLVGNDLGCPEQVHVALGGPGKLLVKWVESKSSSQGPRDGGDMSTLYWGSSPDIGSLNNKVQVQGYTYSTDDGSYTSPLIFHANMDGLSPGQTYYYRVGAGASYPNACMSQVYPVVFPSEDTPTRFALVGDLGQTEHSLTTIDHMIDSKPAVVVHVGDLSYADCEQWRWDTWGRLVEKIAARIPYMTASGNHEDEGPSWCPSVGLPSTSPFLAYITRYVMPYKESPVPSPSNHFYSFDLGLTHVIVLGSWVDFSSGSDQYKWVVADLAAVDRQKTPWVIAMNHSPWYNSNEEHQKEYQSDDMRYIYEPILKQYGVDALFAGHVHSYERSYRIFNYNRDDCGLVHVTIGDGGNREGLASKFLGQPSWSADREASYGFGTLDILNASTALWTWHRNQDSESSSGDSVYLTRNLACDAQRALLLRGSAAVSAARERLQEVDYEYYEGYEEEGGRSEVMGEYEEEEYGEEGGKGTSEEEEMAQLAQDFEYVFGDEFDPDLWDQQYEGEEEGGGSVEEEEEGEGDSDRLGKRASRGSSSSAVEQGKEAGAAKADDVYDEAYEYLYGEEEEEGLSWSQEEATAEDQTAQYEARGGGGEEGDEEVLSASSDSNSSSGGDAQGEEAIAQGLAEDQTSAEGNQGSEQEAVQGQTSTTDGTGSESDSSSDSDSGSQQGRGRKGKKGSLKRYFGWGGGTSVW